MSSDPPVALPTTSYAILGMLTLRPWTAYAISDEGRRAFGAWLATQPGPPRFELETMLRLVYADQGTKDELLVAVQAARDWAEARYADGREQVRGYLADGGPFPDRLHLTKRTRDLQGSQSVVSH